MKRRRAFTLIEVLVVVAIIALLVAILLPSLKKARLQARRATCSANLHQVGTGMMSYMHDSRERMPWVSLLPSLSAAPVTAPCRATISPPDCDPIFLADVLRPNLSRAQSRGEMSVLRCPDDRPASPEGWYSRDDSTAPPMPYSRMSYFESERCSYEYRTSMWDPLESTCRHASLSIL